MLPETRVRLALSVDRPIDDPAMRVALLTWLFSRSRGGEVLLRLDRDEAADRHNINGLFDDLQWLGLDWDEFGRQSSRHKRHMKALDRLRWGGHLYACFETEEELKALNGRRYDRAALNRSAEEQAALLALGQEPHLRLKLPDGQVAWRDMIQGPIRVDRAALEDPIVADADGMPTHILRSAVDDGETLTSHVIAPEDEMTDSAVRRTILELLGYRLPDLGHVPFDVAANRETLSSARTGDDAPGAYLRHLLGPSRAAPDADHLDDWILRFSLEAFR